MAGKSYKASSTADKVILGESTRHTTVRIMLVIHIIATAYFPTKYIQLYQHLWARIVVALLVVALLFWDVIAGALLAILLVLSIQEAKSRQTGASAVSIASAMPSQLMRMATGSVSGPVLVPGSVYGQQQPPLGSENDKVGAYMSQIGELGISSQIRAGQGVQMHDGVPSFKSNMGQLSAPSDQFLGNFSKDGFETQSTAPTVNLGTGSGIGLTNETGSAPTVNLGTEYDHPANKTMSENLKIQATGFITDKNLVDAQINSVGGLDGAQPPCFVASESGIWNAQGFGSIARAVDNEDCPHSFV